MTFYAKRLYLTHKKVSTSQLDLQRVWTVYNLRILFQFLDDRHDLCQIFKNSAFNGHNIFHNF